MSLSSRDNAKLPAHLRSQSGQGVLEYILMIVVGVIVILGIVVQFNDAFRVWGNNYFADYLSCLLETGELPALGGSSGEADGGCNSQFKPFSIADGRPAISDSSGDGSGGGSSSGRPDRGSGSTENQSGGGDGQYTKVNSDSDKKGGAGAGGSGQGSTREMSGGGSSGDAGGGGGGRGRSRSQPAPYTGSTEDSLPAGAESSGRRVVRNKSVQQEMTGGFFVSRESRSEQSADGSVMLSQAEELQQRQKRIRINRKPAEVKTEDANTQLTLGDYLRYILIAAVIIALVVVLGGQAMQVSKEME